MASTCVSERSGSIVVRKAPTHSSLRGQARLSTWRPYCAGVQPSGCQGGQSPSSAEQPGLECAGARVGVFGPLCPSGRRALHRGRDGQEHCRCSSGEARRAADTLDRGPGYRRTKREGRDPVGRCGERSDTRKASLKAATVRATSERSPIDDATARRRPIRPAPAS